MWTRRVVRTRGHAVGAGTALPVTTLLVTALLAACGPASVAAPTVPPGPAAPTESSAAPGATGPTAANPAGDAADPATAWRAVPLYYVTDTPAGPRLAREFRRLPVDAEPAAAGSAALDALFAAPAGAVPGHRNPWPAGSALASPVRHDGGVVTVDLTSRAAQTAPADPVLAVQQLVYTVTGALGTADPVRVLVAGAQVPRLWRDGVDTAVPVARADPLGVRLLVGIDEPAPGAAVASPVRVTGEAAVFEATLRWEVRRGAEVIRSGEASTAEGQRFSPYSFAVALPPGEYEIRVAEDDPSDGAGRPVVTDTRRVTVTG